MGSFLRGIGRGVPVLLFSGWLAGAVRATSPSPAPPCVAVLASFPEELAAVEKMLVPEAVKLETTFVNGVRFHSADLGGQRFVFLLTGMSLVNAAASTQLVLDRCNVQAVFFAGIAGGVNPALGPGDVVVPARWRYHSEAAYFNETAPGRFRPTDWYKQRYPNFGMIHPDNVHVIREGMEKYEPVESFPADERLLALARRVTDTLPALTAGGRPCRLVHGGTGVSGTVFCDNAEYRKWVSTTFGADCLDMESTAVAQVCWANRVPCLIVRGLSDLAGGQTGKNQEEEYLHAAADHAALVLVTILRGYTPLPGAEAGAAPAEAAAAHAEQGGVQTPSHHD